MSEQHHEIKVMIDGITEEFFPDAIVYWNYEEVEDAGYDPSSGNSLTMSRTTSTEWEVDYADVDCKEINEALDKLPEIAEVTVRVFFENTDSTAVSSSLPKHLTERFLCSVLEEVAQDNGFDGE